MPDTDDRLIEKMEKRFPSPIKSKKAKEIRQMGLSNLQVCKEKSIKKEELEAKKLKELRANEAPKKPENQRTTSRSSERIGRATLLQRIR
jgi:hypothetical protein